MADEEKETETEVVAEQPKGGMGKMLMLVGTAIAMLITGIFAGPMIMNMFAEPPAEDGAPADEAVVDSAAPAIYQSLHPPLVINLNDSFGDSHFMQITLEVMSRDQESINALREHTPAIRNALILYFGTAKYDEVVTREGKERLLAQALVEIQTVMQQRTGKPGVEAAYFTSLIVQ